MIRQYGNGCIEIVVDEFVNLGFASGRVGGQLLCRHTAVYDGHAAKQAQQIEICVCTNNPGLSGALAAVQAVLVGAHILLELFQLLQRVVGSRCDIIEFNPHLVDESVGRSVCKAVHFAGGCCRIGGSRAFVGIVGGHFKYRNVGKCFTLRQPQGCVGGADALENQLALAIIGTAGRHSSFCAYLQKIGA